MHVVSPFTKPFKQALLVSSKLKPVHQANKEQYGLLCLLVVQSGMATKNHCHFQMGHFSNGLYLPIDAKRPDMASSL